MPRDFDIRLQDMLQALERIIAYSAGLDEASFRSDRKTQDAIVRNLEVLGEAARQVPESIRRLAPEIEWRKIAGLRDVLIHQYFEIELSIVWDIVAKKTAEPESRVRALLTQLPPTGEFVQSA